MKNLLKTSLLLAAFAPAAVLAQATAGDREITLSGAGSSDSDFENNVISLDASFGQYLSDQGMAGIRQFAGLSKIEGEDTRWTGATRLFYDHHFGDGSFRPFVGVNVGGIYGEGVDETFFGGPEAGLKFYAREKTFVHLTAEYQFFFDNMDEAENTYDDGSFVYSVGVGYNF